MEAKSISERNRRK